MIGPSNNYPISFAFLFYVGYSLRRAIRIRSNIPGDDCNDCCVSWWCSVCSLTQIVGQLWSNPDVNPGCNCSEDAAAMP